MFALGDLKINYLLKICLRSHFSSCFGLVLFLMRIEVWNEDGCEMRRKKDESLHFHCPLSRAPERAESLFLSVTRDIFLFGINTFSSYSPMAHALLIPSLISTMLKSWIILLFMGDAPLVRGRDSPGEYTERGILYQTHHIMYSIASTRAPCSPMLLPWSHPWESFWVLYLESDSAVCIKASNIFSILLSRIWAMDIKNQKLISGTWQAKNTLPLLTFLLPVSFPTSLLDFICSSVLELTLPVPFLPHWIIYSLNIESSATYVWDTKMADLVLFSISLQSSRNTGMLSWFILQKLVWMYILCGNLEQNEYELLAGGEQVSQWKWPWGLRGDWGFSRNIRVEMAF